MPFSEVELTELAIAGGADTVSSAKSGSTRDDDRCGSTDAGPMRKARVALSSMTGFDVAIASQADECIWGKMISPSPWPEKSWAKKPLSEGRPEVMEEARRVSPRRRYIGVGPVFQTSSKMTPARRAALIFRERSWSDFASHHCHRRHHLQQYPGPPYRVHGIAVISAVCCQEDPWGRPGNPGSPGRGRRGEKIGDIGEFGLIRRINGLLKREGFRSERVTIGIGDDTASFSPPGYELLVTCDSMVEGRHFCPGIFLLGSRTPGDDDQYQ